MHEINGDEPLTPWARLAYLSTNMARNAGGAFSSLRRRHWAPSAGTLTQVETWSASPVRILMELFLETELPRLLPARRIRVLDVGCGSGRMRHVLARAGFRGHYVGIDVDDRFVPDETDDGAFASEFILGDATTAELEGPFDLILSVSALEHVAHDARLVDRLRDLLAADGMQLHLVPSPWSLFAYLWHGFRQYGKQAIGRRFDPARTQVHALGGLPSLLMHVSLITVCEVLFRWPVRVRAPKFYRRLVEPAVRLDRYVPICPPTYGVLERPVGGSAG